MDCKLHMRKSMLQFHTYKHIYVNYKITCYSMWQKLSQCYNFKVGGSNALFDSHVAESQRFEDCSWFLAISC